MGNSYVRWPAIPNGITVYATAADLPAVASTGSFAATLDTDKLYIYNGGWVAIGSSSSVLGIGTIDSGTPSANGAHVDSNLLIMQSASATRPGLVNLTTQTFAGAKTFSANVAMLSQLDVASDAFLHGNLQVTGTASASNLSGTNTGNVTLGTASGLSLVGQALSLALSSTSTTGALSSTDWNTFNNKQATLTLGNLTDAGTDGIVVTGGTGAVVGSGTSIAQHVADATHNGYLSSTDWSTFNGKQATLTIGNLTDAGTDGIVITGGTGSIIGSGTSLAQHVADSTHNGYLSSTDWGTFNGKQAAGNYLTALTGDGTASGPGSAALTLATVNTNVGSFGSSTAIPSFTVNGKGLVTAASTNVVIAPAGTLTGATLAANVLASSLTSVGTIATGVWNGTAVDATHGGTNQTSWATGDMLYASAANTLSKLAIGTANYLVKSVGGIPVWSALPTMPVARASTGAAQSITNGATPLIIDYGTVDEDPFSAVTTGASWHFTVPAGYGGRYLVTTMIMYGSAVFTGGNFLTLYLYKNGVAVGLRGASVMQATGTGQRTVYMQGEVLCAAGDTIDVRATTDEVTPRTLQASVVYNYVTIAALSA